jgi:hypothetical protein
VVEQTSLVDAIAQTMIGEWMWKYVRRRRSFGMPEAAAIEMELGRGSDASNGMRHKRWVWLAPYERAVMWSSKQPTSGSALLGKSGRKRECWLENRESCCWLTMSSYDPISPGRQGRRANAQGLRPGVLRQVDPDPNATESP